MTFVLFGVPLLVHRSLFVMRLRESHYLSAIVLFCLVFLSPGGQQTRSRVIWSRGLLGQCPDDDLVQTRFCKISDISQCPVYTWSASRQCSDQFGLIVHGRYHSSRLWDSCLISVSKQVHHHSGDLAARRPHTMCLNLLSPICYLSV